MTSRWRAYAAIALAPVLLLAHAGVGAWLGLRDGAAEIAAAWRFASGR